MDPHVTRDPNSRPATNGPADAAEPLMPHKPLATLAEAFQIARYSDGPINERLAMYAKTLRAINPGASDAIDHLVDRLKGAGAGLNAPRVGEPLPPFLLPDDSARLVSLEGLLEKGPVAIAFH